MSDKSAALAELRFLLADQHAREDSAAVAARLRLLDRWLSSNRDLANNSESMTEFFGKNTKLSLVPLVWVSLQPEISSILTAAHYYPDTLRKYQEG